MEPILTKRGEEAARRAASEFALGESLAAEDEEGGRERRDSDHNVVESICIILFLEMFEVKSIYSFLQSPDSAKGLISWNLYPSSHPKYSVSIP